MIRNRKQTGEYEKKSEERKNRPAGRRCCKCKELNAWRIKLRQCGHFVCIACILEHLKYWIGEENKARIKCAKRTCPNRIHENDIDAVLDPDNDDLEIFMKRAKREYLLHEHRKHSIYYAFGGLIQRCPLCKALYTEYDGCNFVQCVNIRCKQQFCWVCNEPTESLQHFAGGRCKLGWDDLFKICFILKFLAFTEGFLLVIFLPFVSTTLIYFGPLLVLITLPYQIILLFRECMRRMGKTPWTITTLAVLLYPIMMLAAVPFAIGSLVFLIPVSTAYCIIAIIKCIPAFSRACDVIYLMSMLAGCFGLDQWRIILRENYEANRQHEIKIAQEEEELSERDKLPTCLRHMKIFVSNSNDQCMIKQ
ncbi:hypothetical protein LOAG_03756 [Loa loa]|uniref:RING-type domain-containing protein n=1 Tax=Loa loa TaxID=7209 RepID=A0A1S0U4H1_LOALO|nr:hypothetical protein LOAG_03756 [Loa loa]EFO24732.1 hypothetical protein LOAG_03756 [Loa loa]